MDMMTKLFCIPYAGGSSLSYVSWIPELKDDIQIIPVELSGRGYRYNEKKIESFEDAVKDILGFIEGKVDMEDCSEEYALMGHSMGGLLAYELYYKIKQAQLRLPKYIILSAINLPSHFSCKSILKMNPDEFEEYILAMGGIPKEILKNENSKRIIMNRIYSDYSILGSYEYKEHQKCIECDSYILCGSEDMIAGEKDILKWGSFFEKPIKQIKIKGGHFFIYDSFHTTMNVIKLINATKL